MPIYTDPITLESMEINNQLFFYLIQMSNNNYKFCALSLRDPEGALYNLDQLQFDPTTRIVQCWPIGWDKVVSAEQSILFPQGLMRNEPYARDEIIHLFALDPFAQTPVSFNAAARVKQAQTLGMVNSYMLKFIQNDICLNAIQNGIFTLQDLVTMDFRLAVRLAQPESINAIHAGIFTTQELVALGYTKAGPITRPSCIQAIQNGIYTKELLIAIDRAHLEWITDSHCIQAIRNGIFTLQEFLDIDANKVPRITDPNIIKGILHGVFTKQAVLDMNEDKLRYLCMFDRVDTLHAAIQDGRTTLEQIEEMDLDTLKQAVSTGDFYAHGMGFN